MKNYTFIGCLIAIGFFVGIATAVSKEMHPKLHNNQTQIQKSDTKEQQSSQPPIIVNVSPPQRTHDEIDQEAKDRKEKADSDKKLVEFTRQLAIATGALVIANVVLRWFAYLQRRDTRESIALTQKTLVLTQRPRLRIRNVTITQNWGNPETDPFFQKDQPIKGSFLITNVGGTDASIVESLCVVYPTRKGLPINRPYEQMPANNPAPTVTLKSGDYIQATFTSKPLGPDANDISILIAMGVSMLWGR